ncbi:hypothetical protein GCK72_025405 [Caenorhabditis remanei]|uniref:Uncharacterized protein n=1 Tax=Caenorhabditis remanei TaxID=31234 RepID=A0A6A5G1X3_CAERE|nr:hypothetical protein GCK72_025405 [Caenorhabditis remanei]KAF1748938.1 hypothetical protein GCK72_025405 [Caenorhabditis remanei]
MKGLKTIVPLNVHKKDDKNKTTQVVPPTVTTPKPTLAPTAHQPVSTIVQTLLQSLPDTDQSVALLRNIKEQYALTFQRIPWSKRSRARTFKHIEEPSSHIDVFPPIPKPHHMVIPIGGLAKCQCSIECTKTLPMPAYHNVTYENRWNFETPMQRVSVLQIYRGNVEL